MGTSFVPTPILSGFRDNDLLTSEFAAIATELARMVSRFGDTPNSMEAELDLNSHRLLNVSEGTLGTDGVNLNQITNLINQIVSTAIASGGTGQGQTTGDPITFNFGVATGSQGLNNRTEFELDSLFGVASFLGLTVIVNGVVQIPGLAYSVSDITKVTFTESVESDSDLMFIYGDLSPIPVFGNANATLAEATATATLGQTVFTAPTYTIGSSQLMVHIDGVMQSLGFADYVETSTTSITLDTPMSGGERITIRNITGT